MYYTKKLSLRKIFFFYVVLFSASFLNRAVFALGENTGDIRVREFLANPASVTDSNGEWIEIENTTGGPLNLQGWSIDDGGATHIIAQPLIIPSGERRVICTQSDVMLNGGVQCAYEWTSMSLSNAGDVITIKNEVNVTIYSLSYGAGMVSSGISTNVSLADVMTLAPTGIGSPQFGLGDFGTPYQNTVSNGVFVLPTIQFAINTAIAGDTIKVNNGVYAEKLIIDKAITLEGEPGNLTIEGADINAPILDGGVFQNSVQNISAFQIQEGVDNVFIQGFRIQNYTPLNNGVLGFGISGKGNSSNQNIQIHNNTFQNIKTAGVLLESNIGDLQTGIEYNTFDNIGIGISLYSPSASDIYNNTFENLNVLQGGVGIRIACWSDIQNNVACNGNHISENTFTGTHQYGIQIQTEGGKSPQIDTLVIDKNTMSGNFVGITAETFLAGDTIQFIEIAQNNFTLHNHETIRLDQTGGIFSDVTIRDNHIGGINNTGIIANSGVTANAQYNWWGQSSGPSIKDTDVNYIPWFYESGMTTVTGMVVGITSSLLNGWYKKDDIISIDVLFDQKLTLTGGNVKVNTNNVQKLNMNPFSAKTGATILYTVGANQDKENLDIDSFVIEDFGVSVSESLGRGLPVVLNIPNGSNLADNKNIHIDSTRPVFHSIGVVSDNPYDGNYAQSNSQLTFTLTLQNADSFNGGGSGTGQIRFKIGNGVEQSIDLREASSSVKSSTYTAQFDVSGYGVLSENSVITITGIDFKDFVGNAIDNVPVFPLSPTPTVLIDNTKPQLQEVRYTTSNGNTNWAKQGDLVTYTVVFTEPVLRKTLIQPTTSNNVSIQRKEFNINTYQTSDTIIFEVDNGDNGNIQFQNAEISVVDRAGNTSVFTETEFNNALAIWKLSTGNTLQTDTTPPTASQIQIYSNNVRDTTLAKTNDTITIDMTTADNLSTMVSLVNGSSSLLLKPFTASSLGLVGANKTISRMTDGSETSETVVPFVFQIQDEAGNVSLLYSTTNDGSDVRFDRTDPIFQNVSIQSISADLSAFMGDIPIYYAKQGDEIVLTFEARDYVGIVNPPFGTILGMNASFTQGPHLGGGWYEWTARVHNINGTEGTVLVQIDVPDNAGNTVQITATTDGSSVVFDATRPELPTNVSDAQGNSIIDLKSRGQAQFTWTGDTDPNTSGADQVSGLWKYKTIFTNPYATSVDPYSQSGGSLPHSSHPYSILGEIHKGSTGSPIEVILSTDGRFFDGRTTQLNPWASSNGRIPPRENSRANNRYYPYQLRMITVDKAGNHSCDSTGLYCSTKNTLNWNGEPVYEQPYGIAVVGTILDANKNPIEGALIQVVARYGEYCDGSKELCTKTTDANGRYALVVNKDQKYSLIVYKNGYYVSKQDTEIAENGGVYFERDKDVVLTSIQSLKEIQTQDKKITLWSDAVFKEVSTGNTIQSYIQIYSLSGDIQTRNENEEFWVTSQSRITGIVSNNPSAVIIDMGNNQWVVRGIGKIRNIKSGLSDGSIDIFQSGESKLGVIEIPASGKTSRRYAGQKREDRQQNNSWTEEDTRKEIEMLNKGVKPQVKTYENRNGYAVFAGYQPGKIPLSEQKRFENDVRYRGTGRNTMMTQEEAEDAKSKFTRTQEGTQNQNRLNRKQEKAQEILSDESQMMLEKIQSQQKNRIEFQKKKRIGFRKTRSDQAYLSVLTKRSYDKANENKAPFQVKPEKRTRVVSRIQKQKKNLVIRGTGGKKVSMSVFSDQYMARNKPKKRVLERKE